MAPYQYTMLPNDSCSIRLLRLQPSCDPSAKIECTVFHTTINHSGHTSYEALSYTWGDMQHTAEIYLSGHAFNATVNLGSALRALRMPDKPRTLWVDAVCINQGDLGEQAAQVRMMWDIYNAADCVVVWLGPEVGDSATALENFARKETQARLAARKQMRERPANNRDSRWCGCHAGDFDTHPPRIGIQSVLGSRWFTRVWVLQEVAAAKRVVVACGDKTVSGTDFHDELTSTAGWYNSFQKIMRKCRPALQLMNKSTAALTAASLPLLELIEAFRTWDSTKEVDKVFALLAFSSDASQVPELQPDYTIPPHVLAQRLVQFAFPTCMIDEQSSTGNEVTFGIEGLLLGEINSKMTDTARAFSFHCEGKSKIPDPKFSPVARKLFSRNESWEIQVLNERKLSLHATVVLLRGASRPSVLRYHEGNFIVEMLASPEPTKAGGTRWDRVRAWPTAVKALSSETEDLVKFKLSWDPFRQALPSEISRYTPAAHNTATQWEAKIESLKDEVANGGTNDHNCRTISMLNILYQQDKDAIKAGTSKFTMTIHKAAYNGYYNTVKLLLDANVSVDAKLDDFGTALHLAALRGHTKIVKALLDANATVDSLDGSGETPLDKAASEQHSKICQMLLDAGASLPVRSPVFGLAIQGSIETLRIFLNAGADANQVCSLAGFGDVTALHLAAEMGQKECVDALLQAGAYTDPRTTTATTPLHQASMNGHTDVVEVLLRAGADVNAKDDNGATPLDFALHREQQQTAEALTLVGGMISNFRGGPCNCAGKEHKEHELA